MVRHKQDKVTLPMGLIDLTGVEFSNIPCRLTWFIDHGYVGDMNLTCPLPRGLVNVT
jgi:hypothetical protein